MKRIGAGVRHRAPGFTAAHSFVERIRAQPASALPSALPWRSQAATCTWEFNKIRLTLPVLRPVTTYKLSLASANVTGVETGVPFFRNVVRLIQLCPSKALIRLI